MESVIISANGNGKTTMGIKWSHTKCFPAHQKAIDLEPLAYAYFGYFVSEGIGNKTQNAS